MNNVNYKQKLFPWAVAHLDAKTGMWVTVQSFRLRKDADDYKRILANSSNSKVEVIFTL
jgi:hypothetical protein